MYDRPLLLPDGTLFVNQESAFAARRASHLNRKDKNRQALIDATLDCIAEIGLIRTSVSEIISRAGLSRGMIHLHFGGKDNLLAEAARYANEQYYNVLNKNISAAVNDSKHKLEAVIKSDLSPEVLNARDASIWHEFRGAARTNAEIARFSDTRDQRLHDLVGAMTTRICIEEGLPDAEIAARDYTTGLIALTEGLWTDYLLHPTKFDRKNAERVVFRFLSGVWSGSFNEFGAV